MDPGLDSDERFDLDGLIEDFTGRPVGRRRDMANAKDPVCGMEVDTASDLKFEYDGETYYFCSRGCKLDFEEDPGKYLDPEYEPQM